jgi:hypothetical protein
MTTEANPQTQMARSIPLEPESLSQAIELSKILAQSALVPDALKGKPNDVLMIALTGRDLGLSFAQSIRAIYVVKGRPALSSAFKISRAQLHADCLYFRLVESTEEKATWETQRRGQPEPVRLTWTMAMAKKAGLGGDSWNKYGATMLRWRAGSALADAVYSDAMFGMPSVEELDPDDSPLRRDVTPPPQPVYVSASKAPEAVVDAEFTQAEPAEEDPVAKAHGWVAQAKDKAELSAVAELIAGLPQAARDAVRPAYAARLAEFGK